MRQGLAAVVACVLVSLVACGDDSGGGDDDGTDVTTERCVYEPMTPTANAGGTVEAGALMAGAAETVIDIPVGVALGGYTGRAGFLSSAGTVDARKVKTSSTFNPSIGVELAPRVKVVVLSAGGETVVLAKIDAIFIYEGLLFDLEQALGAQFAGKVVLAASHSHSAWAQFTGHTPLKLGSGELRTVVFQRYIDTLVAVTQQAIANQRPARLGVYMTSDFDPADAVNRDRRGENDAIGGTKDKDMALLRIDGTDGEPIAIVPIVGGHPVLNDEDNPFATADAVGAAELLMQEQFSSQVVVMQLQSAGGDVSFVGHGNLNCDVKPGDASDPCFTWTKEEGHGRAAVVELMAAWTAAGTNMRDSLEIEMLTRSIELGPKPSSFSIRDGALTYKFDTTALPDRVVMDGATLANPIDEFNAPVGAALCETEQPMFPAAAIEGTEGLLTYGSCLRLDLAGEILGPIFKIDFAVDATHPVCETTRTTLTVLRLGDYVFGTMPGELTVPLKKLIMDSAPDPTKTIVIGYAQGHVGYLLRPEDWVLGGYEPSVTFWGPLEGEMIAEKLAAMLPLALTPMREDGTTDGVDRVATARITDDLEADDPAMMAGTVPDTVPSIVWSRLGAITQAQPQPTIERVSGIAQFVFIGDDPLIKTPKITLQVSNGSGGFVDVVRNSGRKVQDMEVLLSYTPSPLQRSGPQTHFWVVEWQAVPWVGHPTLDDLGVRNGLQATTYRFHVEGNGWTLDSAPFDVVPGGMSLSQPSNTGGQVKVTVNMLANKGWRLLSMTGNSNVPVPLRQRTVTVELIGSAAAAQDVTTDANGVATVTSAAGATMVRVTDEFGNTATIPLP